MGRPARCRPGARSLWGRRRARHLLRLFQDRRARRATPPPAPARVAASAVILAILAMAAMASSAMAQQAAQRNAQFRASDFYRHYAGLDLSEQPTHRQEQTDGES